MGGSATINTVYRQGRKGNFHLDSETVGNPAAKYSLYKDELPRQIPMAKRPGQPWLNKTGDRTPQPEGCGVRSPLFDLRLLLERRCQVYAAVKMRGLGVKRVGFQVV